MCIENNLKMKLKGYSS